MPTFSLEQSYQVPVIGVDEAGRGPWAGPVMVSGVLFHAYTDLPCWVSQLNDSKKLSSKKRDWLFDQITSHKSKSLLSYTIQAIDVDTIDRVNILEATMQGMRQCIDTLMQNHDMVQILVDGNRLPKQVSWCRSVIKGDSISTSIAAASILAKVSRDRLMRDLSEQYPYYSWETNSGYGTAAHQAALAKYGVSPHHRKSFAPIRALCV